MSKQDKNNTIAALFEALVIETAELGVNERARVWDELEKVTSIVSQCIDKYTTSSVDTAHVNEELARKLHAAHELLTQNESGLSIRTKAELRARSLLNWKDRGVCPVCNGERFIGGSVKVNCPVVHAGYSTRGVRHDSSPDVHFDHLAKFMGAK